MSPASTLSESLSPTEGGALTARAALMLVLSFWAFYFAISVGKSLVLGEALGVKMVLSRAAVAAAGGGATTLIYLGLRLVKTHSVIGRLAAALLLSIPAAASFGFSTWYMLEEHPPATQSAATIAANQASPGVTVGLPRDNGAPRTARMVAAALNGYFFFVAWCGLYLALTYSVQLASAQARAARLHAAAQAANLRALRYQVNPHFLFNTLNAISSLVLSGRSTEAERMVTGLASFFRASLVNDPTADVSLADELALQRLYLNIETARFPDRLRIDIDVPEALEEARVPGLILQPLVENVVKHAVSRSRRPVTLAIAASRKDDRLTLTVSDDGTTSESEPDAGSGVGLANVRERIAARFGTEGDVRWGPRAGGGFEVVLNLPMLRDEP